MQRENYLKNWVTNLYPNQAFSLNFAASDADFRKYYRAKFEDNTSIILMDTPPNKINLNEYIYVQQLFKTTVRVPEIYHINQNEGFMAIEDFGDDALINVLFQNNQLETHRFFLLLVVDELIKLQKSTQPDKLPLYSHEKLQQEMELFVEWCIPKYFQKQINEAQRKIWTQAKNILISHINTHAKVYVHKDFIIRNLMILKDNIIGVLDFQDAVLGPICYDIVSLTRDAFMTWDESFTLDIVVRYWQQAKRAKLPVPEKFDDFYKTYEWTGVQRHLKIAGIFTRLKYRDNKDKYFTEIPLFIKYLKNTTRRYTELHPLYQLIIELTGPDNEIEQSFSF